MWSAVITVTFCYYYIILLKLNPKVIKAWSFQPTVKNVAENLFRLLSTGHKSLVDKSCGQAWGGGAVEQFRGGMKFSEEGAVLEAAPTDSAGKFLSFFLCVICKSWLTTQQHLPRLKWRPSRQLGHGHSASPESLKIFKITEIWKRLSFEVTWLWVEFKVY